MRPSLVTALGLYGWLQITAAKTTCSDCWEAVSGTFAAECESTSCGPAEWSPWTSSVTETDYLTDYLTDTDYLTATKLETIYLTDTTVTTDYLTDTTVTTDYLTDTTVTTDYLTATTVTTDYLTATTTDYLTATTVTTDYLTATTVKIETTSITETETTATTAPITFTYTVTTSLDITLCETRQVNPTYAAPTPQPTDYTWGCPPGFVCIPPQEGCNFERGLPDPGYYCEPSQCVPAPALLADQYWGNPVTDDSSPLLNPALRFDVTTGYFNMNPLYFDLSYNIFYKEVIDVFTSTVYPPGAAATGKPRQRQAQTYIPAACFDECNDCLLEAQVNGKTPKLCASGSAFSTTLNYCEQCIVYHHIDDASNFVQIQPQFEQFIDYCAEHSVSLALPSSTATVVVLSSSLIGPSSAVPVVSTETVPSASSTLISATSAPSPSAPTKSFVSAATISSAASSASSIISAVSSALSASPSVSSALASASSAVTIATISPAMTTMTFMSTMTSVSGTATSIFSSMVTTIEPVSAATTAAPEMTTMTYASTMTSSSGTLTTVYTSMVTTVEPVSAASSGAPSIATYSPTPYTGDGAKTFQAVSAWTLWISPLALGLVLLGNVLYL